MKRATVSYPAKNYKLPVRQLRAIVCFLFAGVIAAAAPTARTTAPVSRIGMGTVVRRTLTASELTEPLPLTFAVKMRNFEELRRRVQRGEVLSLAEMSARYFPSSETWGKVAEWARQRGYSVEADDFTHMTVFATTTVAQAQQDFRTHFARVIGTDGAECTSLMESETIPSEIATEVRSIRGLRPHLKPRQSQSAPVSVVDGNGVSYLNPKTVAQIYNADGQGLDGSGQTIVIVGTAIIDPTDLTTFWTKCGLSTTIAQLTEIDPTPQYLTSSPSVVSEITKDLEWSSAIAPRANLLYITSLDPAMIAKVIFNRMALQPGSYQVSQSTALSEGSYAQAGTTPDGTDYYAALAALGVTYFASSGNYGSNADFVNAVCGPNGYYQPGGVLAPAYPASDPFVMGVGGTIVSFADGPGGSYMFPFQEGGWCLPDPPVKGHADQPPNYGFAASTGGVSLFFDRPSWQTGTSIPAGGKRCVPDVAAIAASAPLPYAYFKNGSEIEYFFNGTSMSSPVWAGLCALLNQGRAKAGFPSVGLLARRLYPLMGTSAFNQMTVGAQSAGRFTATATNGAYGVAKNYNLVTGLGSPNIRNLLAALTVPVAPSIITQPQAQSIVAGTTVTFKITVDGDPPPKITWLLNNVPLADGVLTDGTIVSGASTERLNLANVSVSVNSASIVAVVTSSLGTVTSSPATLTVAPLNVGRLSNISILTPLAPGETLTIGTVIGGAGTRGTKVLIGRAVGPSLEQFGVSAFLPNPVVTLNRVTPTPTIIVATNAGWSGSLTLSAAFTQVGAFPFANAASRDSAILQPDLSVGNYTLQVSDRSGQVGTVLAELYDGTPSETLTANTPRLINVSALKQIVAGTSLTAGFVISGASNERILIRAVGPTLGAAPFRLSGAMANPKLELFNNATGVKLMENVGWGGGVTLIAAFNAVGAFQLADTATKDSVLLTTLAHGQYSARVSSADNGGGIIIVEIYEMPQSN